MPDVLDSRTPVLVTVEDPRIFEQVVRDWEAYGNTKNLAPAERNWKPKGKYRPTRTEDQRREFASYIRDVGHQADLERANQHPVISMSLTPPAGFPVVTRDGESGHMTSTGAIHVTRKARKHIEDGPATGPQPVIDVSVGDPPRDDTEIIGVVVDDDNAVADDIAGEPAT